MRAFVSLESQHHRDPGEVETFVQQRGDLPQPLDVLQAVEPRAAWGALRIHQAGLLTRAQILHPGAHHVCGNRDSEHPDLES